MTDYPRPALDKFLGTGVKLRRPAYPYSRRMLIEHDIFEVLPLDGGAFFFTNQHLGDKSTARFAGAFLSGELLAPWTGGRRVRPRAEGLDWFGAYDPERGPWSPGQRIEQHVWLHRLYFLLPLAQQYLRTGDRAWARRWYEFFIAWRRRCPAMGDAIGAKPKFSAWIWYDMQVAWRLLVLVHSIFMLASRRPRRGGRRAVGGRKGILPAADCLLPSEWAEIYRAVGVHARWVHVDGRESLERGAAGNHYEQKGTALLYAGTLFPEMADAAEWAALGRRILRDHLRREINPDGGSAEAAPSYSHFIAGLDLTAHLLLAANRKPPIPGLERGIRRQYRFLERTMSPSGRTLQVGDSYALDARRDLAVVRRLLPLPATKAGGSELFESSRFVVLRSGRTQVFVDAMDIRCGHIHAAKPNVLVYHRGRPVVVDCGCVNYDLPDYKGRFRGWAAHNVVAPAEFLANSGAGRDIELKLDSCRLSVDGGEAEIVCVHRQEPLAFRWTRRVTLRGDEISIVDRVHSPRRTTWTNRLHLASCRIAAAPRGGCALNIRGTGWALDVVCSSDRRRPSVKIEAHPAIDEKNRPFASPTVACSQSGRDVCFRTELRLS